jgi:hypothetical protein
VSIFLDIDNKLVCHGISIKNNSSASKEELVKDEDKEKIEEIMGGMTCPSNFKCAEKGFEHVCKTREAGLSGRKQLFCEDYTNQKVCKFADSFRGKNAQPYGYFCTCPLRLYLSEKLKK